MVFTVPSLYIFCSIKCFLNGVIDTYLWTIILVLCKNVVVQFSGLHDSAPNLLAELTNSSRAVA